MSNKCSWPPCSTIHKAMCPLLAHHKGVVGSSQPGVGHCCILGVPEATQACELVMSVRIATGEWVQEQGSEEERPHVWEVCSR